MEPEVVTDSEEFAEAGPDDGSALSVLGDVLADETTRANGPPTAVGYPGVTGDER